MPACVLCSFHLGIQEIYNPREGNLEPFLIVSGTLDKRSISIDPIRRGLTNFTQLDSLKTSKLNNDL